MEDNVLQLGGNIELSGFSGLDGGAMIVLKKIIGNYVNKMSHQTTNLEKVSITMKTVHENKYELKAKILHNGTAVNGSAIDRNIYVAVDTALKSIMTQISK